MNRIERKVRELGWCRCLALGCRLVGERLYRTDHYFLFRRDASPVDVPRKAPLCATPITQANIYRFASIFPYHPAIFLRRLASGLNGFFYGREEGVPLGYHWFALGQEYYEPKYRWRFGLASNEAYLFDGYLLAEHRGSSIAVQGLAHTIDTVREGGAENIFSLSDTSNRSSWSLHCHMGFAIVSCLAVTRLFTTATRARMVDHQRYMTREMRAVIHRHARRTLGKEGWLVPRPSLTFIPPAQQPHRRAA